MSVKGKQTGQFLVAQLTIKKFLCRVFYSMSQLVLVQFAWVKIVLFAFCAYESFFWSSCFLDLCLSSVFASGKTLRQTGHLWLRLFVWTIECIFKAEICANAQSHWSHLCGFPFSACSRFLCSSRDSLCLNILGQSGHFLRSSVVCICLVCRFKLAEDENIFLHWLHWCFSSRPRCLLLLCVSRDL